MAASLTVRRKSEEWWRFAVTATAFGLATALFVAWLGLRIGGESLTTAFDDIGEAVAALAAAATCAWAARRSAGRLRRAWALIATAAAVWCAGEIVWTIYEVGLGEAVPYPGLPDVGFVLAVPLTIAGILGFSHTARGTSVGYRLWLDGSIVALALLGAAWSLGLDIVVKSPDDNWLAKALNVGYPVGDIVIGTVLVLAIRRATEETLGRLLLLLAGVAANAIADSAFAYLNATGQYGSIGSELDAGWVAGYLMIALAAVWPSAATDRMTEDKPIDVWQILMPWLAILFAAVVLLIGLFRKHPIDEFGTVLIGLLAILLMISQFSVHFRSNRLLYESRASTATLNDVIAHAPLGVVRIAQDLTVLQANPSFAAMLRVPVAELNGARLPRYFAPETLVTVRERLGGLAMGATDVAEFDSEARRPDGSTFWLHWTATAVHKPGGTLDYFLVMFEDVTARRAAQEVAAANVEVLERLNRMKSEFLTKVSHEFRTALVGIQGFAELMRESDTLDVAEVKNMAGEMYADAQRLNESLTEMIELDAEQTGRTALHIEDVDVAGLVASTVAEFQFAAQNHTIETHVQLSDHVAADGHLLHEVLRSLLGRAISYSPPGSKIDVTARRVDGEVCISVADTGRSNPADIEAQLVGHVGRDGVLDRVTALATGVGLPIARQIVEMHGGRLWFDAGSETVFTFAVPVGDSP